jgi:hypothetical protein
MRYLIPLLFPITLFAETTGNLLPQQFFNNNQGHGGWNCNDPSHNHGNSTVAAVHGDFIENTVTLGDTLNQSEINGGWTSTLGADIWGWNAYDQQVKISQTITDSNGTITTQIRDVAIPGCSGYNCGSYSTYTDSYTQGINSQNDYTIKARFDFTESSQSTSHRAVDLKNPILTIEHSLISVSQATQLKTMSETVYNTVEDIDFYEYVPEEEFKFEITEQPIMEMSIMEEFYFEPQAIEELNAGVVDVFQEIAYDNQTTFEEVPTEIQVEEVYIEASTESFNDTPTGSIIQELFAEERQTDFQTTDSSRITEPELVREEVSTRTDGEVTTEEVSRTGNGETPRATEERVVAEPREESTISETNSEPVEQTESVATEPQEEDTIVAEEVTDEVIGEGETDGGGSGNGGTETVATGEDALESRDTEVEESRTEGSPRVNTQTITVESIEKKVNETLTRIDQRLVATSLIVARAMESPLSMDNYGNTNNNIFINQLNIDGGDYYDQREYVDARDIYAQSQVTYNDPVAKSQRILQESIDNRIRAEEHLKRIRGY